VSTEIVKHQPAAVQRGGGALSLAHMTAQEAWRFAEALAGASLLPGEYRGNPGSVLWAMEYGRALGLDVVTTITTIHVIKGKPTQSADLMLSRAREAGHRVRIKSDRNRCVVSITRHDDPEDENVIEWTLEDAKTAQLFPGKPDSNWAKYPRAMLRARAIAECVRAACPEVLHGAIYTAEELGARVDDAGLPVDAEVQQLRRVPAGESDPWTTPEPQVATEAADSSVEPHPPAQEIANHAADAKDKARIKQLWSLAKTGRLMAAPVRPKGQEDLEELGAYLTRRGGEVPETAPKGDSNIHDAEIVTDTPEDPHDAAIRQLRAAAERAGVTNLEEEFQASYGAPITEATTANVQEMTRILAGAA
jgi:hypothetical protein